MHQDWPEIENISITENGAAYGDGPDADGRVRDVRRIDYMRDHIEAVSTAIDAGAPVQSYYAWSLLDNFEWAEGYDKRFGIIHVDFETLKRTPKDSAEFYASVITQHKAASQVQVG
jgi:beta-glucosidase